MNDAYQLVVMLVHGGCQTPYRRENFVVILEEANVEGQVAKWIELSADASGNLVVRYCPGDPTLNTFEYPGPVNLDELLEMALRAWTSQPHFGSL